LARAFWPCLAGSTLDTIGARDMMQRSCTRGADPGTRLGHYEVQSLIGAGGMGEVYKA
jgi:hypothetical protein